ADVRLLGSCRRPPCRAGALRGPAVVSRSAGHPRSAATTTAVMSADWLTVIAAVVLVGLFGGTVGWTRHARPMLATRVLMLTSSVVAAALMATLVMLAVPVLGRNDA